MHNNVLALRWERRKRREEDKEAKVLPGPGKLLSVSSPLSLKPPNTPRSFAASRCPPWPNKEEEVLSEKQRKKNQ